MGKKSKSKSKKTSRLETDELVRAETEAANDAQCPTIETELSDSTIECDSVRQTEEFEAICGIYPDCVVADDTTRDPTKPLDFKFTLLPAGVPGHNEAVVRFQCSKTYPSRSPLSVTVISSKGLSNEEVSTLTNLLNSEAEKLVGEESIYLVIEVGTDFLLKHNRAPKGSFYDEMIEGQQRAKEAAEEAARLEAERQRLAEERAEQEAIEEEARVAEQLAARRAERVSQEDAVIRPRRESASDRAAAGDSCYGSPVHRQISFTDGVECREHLTTALIIRTERKLRRSKCLAHSKKGCIAYAAIDYNTGQLCYITEWNIKVGALEKKCPPTCNGNGCSNAHTVQNFIDYIQNQFDKISKLEHPNVVPYQSIMCQRAAQSVNVILVQDFLFGTSVESVSGSLGWCAEGASIVARGILNGLIFLHSKGIMHGNLYDANVFMNDNGTIRITDYGIVAYLSELVGKPPKYKSDIEALGALVAALLPTQHAEMRDFIQRCRSDGIVFAQDLLDHPFLQSMLRSQCGHDLRPSSAIDKHSIHEAPPNTDFIANDRLSKEYKIEDYLGRGAYGDVIKVRNILDNRRYAIKRIRLSQNYKVAKKICREVQILSRLNHENVVRYYNSWIEEVDAQELDDMSAEGSIVSHGRQYQVDSDDSDDTDVDDDDNVLIVTTDDDESSIEFEGTSNGQQDDVWTDQNIMETEIKDQVKRRKSANVRVMYIQMEFCEKSTLKLAIEEGLYKDQSRMWRLFREIVEGINHIHSNGLIHRDLKPMNIFIDCNDQVKIGDFGLATSSFLAIQTQDIAQDKSPNDEALTGLVGTALYVAPELMGDASKTVYTLKVDMYSLGVIFFEMCNSSPFETAMERISTIQTLRTPEIVFPENFTNENQKAIIRWLLNHDPDKRPTSEVLLSSSLMPGPPIELAEMNDIFQRVLSNPESKGYKSLIQQCMNQEYNSTIGKNYTCRREKWQDDYMATSFVISKVIKLFRRHGGIEISQLSLTPCNKNDFIARNTRVCRLMEHSGIIVSLPYDLHVHFAQHVVTKKLTTLRRYSVSRVFREKKAMNIHPREMIECAFDVVTQRPGGPLLDAEMIGMAFELATDLPVIKEMNPKFRVTHSTLVRAILSYCNVPKDKYGVVFRTVLDNGNSKVNTVNELSGLLPLSRSMINTLVDLLFVNEPVMENLSNAALNVLLKSAGEAGSLAKGAIKEINHAVGLAKSFGVTCGINLFTTLRGGFELVRNSGVIWEMIIEEKENQYHAIAKGSRLDDLFDEMRKEAKRNAAKEVSYPIVLGAGLSINLERLATISIGKLPKHYRRLDVIVFINDQRMSLKEPIQVMRSLWSCGIKCGYYEGSTVSEALDYADLVGVPYIIEPNINRMIKVVACKLGSQSKERLCTQSEITSYLLSIFRSDSIQSPDVNLNESFNNSVNAGHPDVEVKTTLAGNARKKLVNKIHQQLEPILSTFTKNQNIVVFPLQIPKTGVCKLISMIDPDNLKDVRNITSEGNSKERNYIDGFKDRLYNYLQETKKDHIILCIYSTVDDMYRFVL